ncbi:MAG: hypothetical protein FWG31_10400 [Oscillospiraceae bacterium]|nr:hypothetical protein [Oscillospiraceae bacterium]
MNEKYYDPIVAEVRRNREAMLAEFGGDTKKLTAYFESKRPEMEAAGFHFVTEEERQARIAWNRQRREAEDRRIASL